VVPRTGSKQLWQLALDRYRKIPDGTGGYFDLLHPFDDVLVIHDLQDLRDLGEEPTVAEFRAYLRSVRRSYGSGEKRMCEIWKKLLANPGHRFRVVRERGAEWRAQPYSVAEQLISRVGLKTSVPERLAAVACRRVNELVAAADYGTRAEFDAAQKRLGHARGSIDRLRQLRFGFPWDDT
jgi:hypothetical protein